MKFENKEKVVFVGLSGGVDSSVCALRLLQQGYKVVGVFIKVWHPTFLICNWEQERLDAMRVAAKLKIPFLTCDAEQAYKDDVADYFISEYKAGRTPNPDVMCNKYVKFGAFLKFALEHGADYIATGHYAQHGTQGTTHTLLRGVDTTKDQSYFLWTLTQSQLAKVLLPVGNSKKLVIRSEAQKNGLITADKKDSQGICFLGHIDIANFLSHYIPLHEGDVLSKNGEIIGTHKGALVYTSGQRHGFSIHQSKSNQSSLYVIARDIKNNTITVTEQAPLQEVQDMLTLSHTNYIGWQPIKGETISVQTRYRQTPSRCTIEEVTESSLCLTYQEKGERATAGQSCVLYDKEICCGGGIIEV